MRKPLVSTFATLTGQLPRSNNTGTLPANLTGGGITTNSIESKDISRLSCETINPASPIDVDSDDAVAAGTAWTSGTMEGTGTYTFEGTFLSESQIGKRTILHTIKRVQNGESPDLTF